MVSTSYRVLLLSQPSSDDRISPSPAQRENRGRGNAFHVNDDEAAGSRGEFGYKLILIGKCNGFYDLSHVLIEGVGTDDFQAIENNRTAADPVRAIGIPVGHDDLTLLGATVLECRGEGLWPTSHPRVLRWSKNRRHLCRDSDGRHRGQ